MTRKERQRIDNNIKLLDVPFEIANMIKQQREAEIKRHSGLRLTKKQLTELRKEAKKIGFKVEGKVGSDGKWHIYLTKGGYQRQWA